MAQQQNLLCNRDIESLPPLVSGADDFPAAAIRKEVRKAYVPVYLAELQLTARKDLYKYGMATMEEVEAAARRHQGLHAAVLGDQRDPPWVKDLFTHLETIHRTLGDHTKKLDDHTKKLDRLMQSSDDHSKTLDDHTKTLDRHTKILDDHTKTLERHTKILDDHTKTLDRHTAVMLLNSKRLEDSQDDLFNEVRALTEQVRVHNDLLSLHQKRQADTEELHGRLEQLSDDIGKRQALSG